MALASRRSVWALVTGALVASQVFVVSLPAASTSVSSSCAVLRQWAQPYARQPPTLDQLARFDRRHRLAIYNVVTPAARSSLWQEQLRRFAQQPDLSIAQQAMLRDAIGTLTPAYYAQDDDLRRAAAHRLWSKAEGLFTTAAQRRAWFDIGAMAIVQTTAAPSFTDRLVGSMVVNAQAPFCECSDSFGWLECYPGHCVSSFCQEWQGCGPAGGDECLGVCQ